jgi:hypothetical protein
VQRLKLIDRPFYDIDPPKENNSKKYISVDQFIIEQNQRQTQIQEKSIFGSITSHLNGQLLFQNFRLRPCS